MDDGIDTQTSEKTKLGRRRGLFPQRGMHYHLLNKNAKILKADITKTRSPSTWGKLRRGQLPRVRHKCLSSRVDMSKENIFVTIKPALQTTREKSAKRVHNTKHARNETCIEVYSCSCDHFRRQISRVSRLELFCTRSGKITKSKRFSRKKIFKIKWYELRNVCR